MRMTNPSQYPLLYFSNIQSSSFSHIMRNTSWYKSFAWCFPIFSQTSRNHSAVVSSFMMSAFLICQSSLQFQYLFKKFYTIVAQSYHCRCCKPQSLVWCIFLHSRWLVYHSQGLCERTLYPSWLSAPLINSNMVNSSLYTWGMSSQFSTLLHPLITLEWSRLKIEPILTVLKFFLCLR